MSFEATFTLSRLFDTAAQAMASLHGIALTGVDGYTVDSLNVYPARDGGHDHKVAEPAAPVEPLPVILQASEAPVEQPAPAPTFPFHVEPEPEFSDPALSSDALKELCRSKINADKANKVLIRELIKEHAVEAISGIPACARPAFRMAVAAL